MADHPTKHPYQRGLLLDVLFSTFAVEASFSTVNAGGYVFDLLLTCFGADFPECCAFGTDGCAVVSECLFG